MPYVPTKEILGDAFAKVYGVGAFNINNLEFLQAVIGAGVEESSPVLIEVSEGAVKYAGYGQVQRGADTLYAMVKRYADTVKIPVALHLDHGKDFKYIVACIKAGFGSVMIDASALPYEENLKETLRIVEIAHAVGVSVEAELGTLKGIEDNVEAAESILVDPAQAEDFVKRTRVDFLAPAIGTSHGAFKFKGEARLDIRRLKKVKELTGIPLVLHGASSVPEEMVDLANRYGGKIEGAKGVPFQVLKECVEAGINKVNTDTDIRITFLGVLRKALTDKPSEIDPRKLFGPAVESVKEIVKARMRVLGSSGRA